MKRILLSLLGIFMPGVLLACTSISTERPVGEEIARGPTAVVGETWQTEWQSLKAQARKEGKLAIAGSILDKQRLEMSKAMQEKFGITLEFLVAGASAYAPKLSAEYRAGIYTQDIIWGGGVIITETFRPAGMVETLDRTIFLPEALDPSAWFTRELFFLDKGRHSVLVFASAQAPVVRNTDMVKRDEIKSYRDLLDPRWKGRILWTDPRSSTGGFLFYALGVGLMDLDYLRALGKQDLMILRDNRLAMDWVARGKYPVVMGMSADIKEDFRAAGAPIDSVVPVEGTYVGSMYLTLLRNAPHPSAAKLFMNWILTREGGTMIARASGEQHARVDVPTDFLPPDAVRQPGVKYFLPLAEEAALQKAEYRKVAEEVWGHLIK
ncbi:MAG: extracellular solute-binding protein [Chloroflexi bacterium]|nr:extracellular solute-binding protein [Chloroflexota bacterium]